MNRMMVLFFLLLTSAGICGQQAEISGIARKDKLDEIRLYQVKFGALTEIARTMVAENGFYGFLFSPEKAGYYVIGDERKNQHRLYIKPGDKAELNIYQDRVELTRNNTKENRMLYEWEEVIGMVKAYALDYDQEYIQFDYKHFFPYFMEQLPNIRSFKEGIKSKNKDFERLMKETVDYDTEYYALRFLNTVKIDLSLLEKGEKAIGSRPGRDDYPAYYTTLVDPGKFTGPEVLAQPYGVDLVNLYSNFAISMEEKPYTLENRLPYIPDKLLKAELVLSRLPAFKSYEQVEMMMEHYGELMTEASHKERIDETIARVYVAESGKSAANFTYPDREGRMVSLSDFKGKLVLVDVWAHWCGPCRAQIPHLKKLEEEMHGKDIVFIGVSVDEKKDYGKWEEALDKEGLSGIQLFASGWSKITKDYNIKGIPRFMLFDRNGNVISADAPRPSDPALKRMIEKAL